MNLFRYGEQKPRFVGGARGLTDNMQVFYTVCMYSIVKRLRERGRRKHSRDIQADEGASGVLSLSKVGGIYELKLSDRNDSTMQPVLPILYDAGLTTLGSSRMLFKGLERGPDGAEWAQEWAVQILAA